MKYRALFALVASTLLLDHVAAKVPNYTGYTPVIPPRVDRTLSKRSDPVHAETFQQLIDHSRPELGTFSQRYWWNAEFYNGSGSPIVLNAPGEYAMDNYLGYVENYTLPGMFGQTNGAAVILIEHRFWGDSSPYDDLTTTNLQSLTLDNAIQDLIYFANNVHFPFDLKNTSRPDKAPWILTGCSYPGALSAWIQDLAPGTFWAYHASSAPVEASHANPNYFVPVELAMPRNCSADYKAIIQYVDKVLVNGTDAQIQQLKKDFGFWDLKHNDDFASTLAGPLFSWQDAQFYSGYGTMQQMCDYIENQWPKSRQPIAGAAGVGVVKALQGFQKYSREVMIPAECPGYNAATNNKTESCFGSYDLTSPTYTDTSVRNNANRAWVWMLCNQPFEYWQAWTPDSTSGLISQLFTAQYWRRECAFYFPTEGSNTFGLNNGATVDDLNTRTGGWNNVNTTRLMWVNGEYDPWRSLSVASDSRPGGRLQSTNSAPSFVIPKASHCNDMILANGRYNPAAKAIMDQEIKTMQQWVSDWYKLKAAKGGKKAGQ